MVTITKPAPEENDQVQRDLDDIARCWLDTDMKIRGSDSLDFVDVHKATLRKIMREAYELGQKQPV